MSESSPSSTSTSESSISQSSPSSTSTSSTSSVDPSIAWEGVGLVTAEGESPTYGGTWGDADASPTKPVQSVFISVGPGIVYTVSDKTLTTGTFDWVGGAATPAGFYTVTAKIIDFDGNEAIASMLWVVQDVSSSSASSSVSSFSSGSSPSSVSSISSTSSTSSPSSQSDECDGFTLTTPLEAETPCNTGSSCAVTMNPVSHGGPGQANWQTVIANGDLLLSVISNDGDGTVVLDNVSGNVTYTPQTPTDLANSPINVVVRLTDADTGCFFDVTLEITINATSPGVADGVQGAWFSGDISKSAYDAWLATIPDNPTTGRPQPNDNSYDILIPSPGSGELGALINFEVPTMDASTEILRARNHTLNHNSHNMLSMQPAALKTKMEGRYILPNNSYEIVFNAKLDTTNYSHAQYAAHPWCVMFQLHPGSWGGAWLPASVKSPPIGIYFRTGNLELHVRGSTEVAPTGYTVTNIYPWAIVTNTWLRFRLQVLIDYTGANSLTKLWVNESLQYTVTHTNGINAGGLTTLGGMQQTLGAYGSTPGPEILYDEFSIEHLG